MAKLNKLLPDGTKELKDSGSQVRCLKFKPNGDILREYKDGKPRVNYSMFVGTLNHWWITSPITEIIELKKNEKGLLEYCLFKTHNSKYELTT
jgi:hypothetical protein